VANPRSPRFRVTIRSRIQGEGGSIIQRECAARFGAEKQCRCGVEWPPITVLVHTYPRVPGREDVVVGRQASDLVRGMADGKVADLLRNHRGRQRRSIARGSRGYLGSSKKSSLLVKEGFGANAGPSSPFGTLQKHELGSSSRSSFVTTLIHTALRVISRHVWPLC
jgi:hypothetical protein